MKRLMIISALAALTALTATVATADTHGDAVELQESKPASVAEVIVLFASNEGTGIDPCAAHLKALAQPPLSAYNSYSCLTDKKVPLTLNAAATMETPDKGKLSMTLKKVIPRDNKTPKYDVDVQIDKPDGDKFVSTNVKAPQGKYFFLAGQKHKKESAEGILVFAIRLQAP